MLNSSVFDPKLLPIVQRQLVAGEKLLWVGRPVPLLYAFRDIALTWPLFGASFVLALIILWATSAVDVLFALGLLVVVAVLLAIVIYIASFFHALRTVYALTDQRAMIFTPYLAGIGARRVESYDVRKMGVVDCTSYLIPRGIGNVIFNHTFVRDSYQLQLGSQLNEEYNWKPVVDRIGFYAIRNANEIAEYLSRLKILADRNR